MSVAKVLGSLMLAMLMTVAGWCQTDAQGRALAWQLFEAYEAADSGGNYDQFETLFMSDPQLTKRAFVSTMEYATEVYQSDTDSAREAITFANDLAGFIGQQFGDPTPSALMQKLMRKDASAMAEFASYACALYPGYAAGSMDGPGTYGPNATGPGAYGPDSGPGAASESDYEEDGAVYSDQPTGPNNSMGPGSNSSGPFRPADATGGPPKER